MNKRSSRLVTLLFDGREVHAAERKDDERLRIEVNAPARVSEVGVRLSVPVVDVRGFWHPQQRTPCFEVRWNIQIDAAAQKDLPFVSFCCVPGWRGEMRHDMRTQIRSTVHGLCLYDRADMRRGRVCGGAHG